MYLYPDNINVNQLGTYLPKILRLEYFKIKCVPSGHASDSRIIPGEVFTLQLAHKVDAYFIGTYEHRNIEPKLEIFENCFTRYITKKCFFSSREN